MFSPYLYYNYESIWTTRRLTSKVHQLINFCHEIFIAPTWAHLVFCHKYVINIKKISLDGSESLFFHYSVTFLSQSSHFRYFENFSYHRHVSTIYPKLKRCRRLVCETVVGRAKPKRNTPNVLSSTDLSGVHTREMNIISSVSSLEPNVVTIELDSNEPTSPYGFGSQQPMILPSLNDLNLPHNQFNLLAKCWWYSRQHDSMTKETAPNCRSL